MRFKSQDFVFKLSIVRNVTRRYQVQRCMQWCRKVVMHLYFTCEQRIFITSESWREYCRTKWWIFQLSGLWWCVFWCIGSSVSEDAATSFVRCTTLKVAAVSYFETSLLIYQSVRRHSQDDLNHHSSSKPHWEPKSCELYYVRFMSLLLPGHNFYTSDMPVSLN